MLRRGKTSRLHLRRCVKRRQAMKKNRFWITFEACYCRRRATAVGSQASAVSERCELLVNHSCNRIPLTDRFSLPRTCDSHLRIGTLRLSSKACQSPPFSIAQLSCGETWKSTTTSCLRLPYAMYRFRFSCRKLERNETAVKCLLQRQSRHRCRSLRRKRQRGREATCAPASILASTPLYCFLK